MQEWCHIADHGNVPNQIGGTPCKLPVKIYSQQGPTPAFPLYRWCIMFHRLISHFISLAKTGVESRITKQIISRQEPGSFFVNSFLSIDDGVFLKK